MLVSTTVVSTRIFRPATIFSSRAMATTRSCACWTTAGPSWRASRPIVLSSGTPKGRTGLRLAAADARELAIHQIGTHFTRQLSETPVAHMLQQDHAQHDLGGRAGPTPRLTFLAALGQFLLNQSEQGVVLQHLVGLTHPRLPQIGHLFGDEAIAKAALEPPGGDHAGRSWFLDSSRSIRNNCWLC